MGILIGHIIGDFYITDKNACGKFIVKNIPLENVGKNSIFLGGGFYGIEWVDNNAQKM